LDQARLAAEHSLELGGAISWDRNTAFCKKCLGRLHRMQAELLAPGGGRAELLEQSERLLLEAIERFTELGVEAEVGDCYSLLARTRLVAGDVREARDATQEAEERLVEHGSKDYLDLQIVQGDLMAHSNRRSAEAIYSDVLAQITNEDAQKSEIFARAYLHRGRVRAALRATDNAMADFRRAAQIWDTLEDPNADLAHWEIERNAEWLDRDALQLIGSEPLAVRVRVARMVRERVAVRPVPRARRAKLPERYLRDLIREARERLAIERPEW
jgi:tetratricopeptide (TPR) repeat protein